MGQQVVTVTGIGQRRTAIDSRCGRKVGRHAKPDHGPSIDCARQRPRHQHDPPAIRVRSSTTATAARQLAKRNGEPDALSTAGQAHCSRSRIWLTWDVALVVS
jgi:hypothetical protein